MSKIDKLIENGVKSLMIENLEEKAVSKQQQKFMGMVHAYKKGEMKDAPASVKKAAKGMTKKAAKDFASTKHKGLPTRVDESVIGDILIIAGENNTYEKFTAELIKQKYIMPDELQDPETEKELRDMYDAVADGEYGGMNEAAVPKQQLIAKKPDWAKYIAQHANGEWWYYDDPPRIVPNVGWKSYDSDGYQFGSNIKTDPTGWQTSYQKLNEAQENYPSFQSNKNIRYQDMNISSGLWTYMGKEMRGKGLYKNTNNNQTYLLGLDDIEYFKKHLNDIEVMEPVNENKMKLKTEAIDPKYKAFYDEVYKHVNELDRILGANKPPKVPQDVWNTVYGLVGDIADKVDFLATDLQKHLKEGKMNAKTESIVKRLKEDTEYQKFFKSAMDKFGIKSPADLKGDKKKKEFFDYVDQNYKAKSESLNEDFFAAHSSDNPETRKAITQLNNTFKALQDQYKVPTRVLDTAVDLVNQLVEQGYEDGRAEVEGML